MEKIDIIHKPYTVWHFDCIGRERNSLSNLIPTPWTEANILILSFFRNLKEMWSRKIGVWGFKAKDTLGRNDRQELSRHSALQQVCSIIGGPAGHHF